MRLCGISSRFQLLSPCMRQVTHALLTRPPLSHYHFHSEEIRQKCFVRLACVKHAASVHPEPGSNSHVKSLIGQSKLAFHFIQINLNLLFKGFQSFDWNVRCESFDSPLNYTIDCVNCLVLFESFKVFHCLVINVRCCYSCNSSNNISCTQVNVNTYFFFFKKYFS